MKGERSLVEMDELLRTHNLQQFFYSVSRGRKTQIVAVDKVSISVSRGESLGVVGESGSGKTTLGKTILGLLPAKGGDVFFDGKEITRLRGKQMRRVREKMQMVYQNPHSSLNPRMSIRTVLSRPLMVYEREMTRSNRARRVRELLETVGLSADDVSKYPHEFSGGQKQRIGIARALAPDPDFICLDEPTSALDVSVQAQILNLLNELAAQFTISYMFITHDLGVVGHISDRVAVMYQGQLVEIDHTAHLFKGCVHPYTRSLMKAVPRLDPSLRKEIRETVAIDSGRLVVTSTSRDDGATPGCRFSLRCPLSVVRCECERPDLVDIGDGHQVACLKAHRLAGL